MQTIFPQKIEEFKMMQKKVDIEIEKIKLCDAKNKIDIKINKQVKNEENLVGYNLKGKLIFSSVLVVPLIFFMALLSYDPKRIPVEGYPIFVSIVIIFFAIIIISIFEYYRIRMKYSYNYLSMFKYKYIRFILPSISIVGYSIIYMMNVFKKYNLEISGLLLIIYVYLVFRLYRLIIETQIYEVLNKKYGFDIEVKKWKILISSYPAALAMGIILIMQIYRISKPLIILNNSSSIIGISMDVLGSIGVAVLSISVSLLPLILFDSEEYITGKLLQKYSEELRKEYGYTKKDWYGD